MCFFKIIAIIVFDAISYAYYQVSKNKWQNVNHKSDHEHSLMKQKSVRQF